MINICQNIFQPGISLKALILAVSFLFLRISDLQAQFAGGKGIKEDPYRIANWEQLAGIKDKQFSVFILVGNLDKNSPGYDEYAGPNSNSGLGWLPISNFTGIFDGNNFSISDLVINRPVQSTIGLFGKAGNAQFKNLQLNNFLIKGGSDTGGLLGVGIKVKIFNCSFDGQVEGKYYVGGLVGTIGNSEIADSYSLGTIAGYRSAGGIAGNAYQTNLNRSFSSGRVSANLEVGGLVGYFHSQADNLIQDSYSVSHVTANEVAGGLVGRFRGAILKTSYAAGTVFAKSQVGGLVGWTESKVTFIDSFWDVEKTGQDSNSGGGSGMNTKALKGKDSLALGYWNFSDVWEIKEPTDLLAMISYPYLKSIKYDPVGQKVSKNPIPGLENARVPSGLNFPQEMLKTYGDPDYNLGEEVDHLGQPIIYTAEDSTILRINGNSAMILKAGTTKVKATIATTSTFSISNFIPLEQTVTVEPAGLQVSVVSGQKKVFGSSDQEFGFSVSGLKYDDSQEIVSGELQRVEGENVGQYQINQGTLNSGGNYKIEFSPSYFEIIKKEVILEAVETQKIFGNSDPELTYHVVGLDVQEIANVISGNVKRAAGEKVGEYEIGFGDLKASSNYELDFREAVFEIVPAELGTVLDPIEVETPWATLPNLPSHVSALTKDGQILELPVTWEKSQLNLFVKGSYLMAGVLGLPDGIQNPELLNPVQKLTILPKSAPEDVRLSNDKFEPASTKAVSEIGKLTVIDKADDSHAISLVEGSLDNALFQVNGNSLSWKNQANPEIKNQYSILVKIEDRGGNVIQKEFLLNTMFTRISEIEVFNTFTPDHDGVNDDWGVPALGTIESANIQIYERGGSLIFSTENPDERWDGTYDGKSVPEGTYFWVLNLEKTGETRKGLLNLLRK
ncbi:MBG domain-containing protein [Algoriphagus sp. A40]|uniref:MBG domain-containing protein n=1 Tax=Algoriphagus sp. A40 TaxID=1945863 RepID=UPI00143B9FEF|nr:MBG domain-containing protein [Algoriphagus sp. A40]